MHEAELQIGGGAKQSKNMKTSFQDPLLQKQNSKDTPKCIKVGGRVRFTNGSKERPWDTILAGAKRPALRKVGLHRTNLLRTALCCHRESQQEEELHRPKQSPTPQGFFSFWKALTGACGWAYPAPV